MCGISGIIGNSWQESSLKAMLDIQHHRGPDGSGTYISKDHLAGLNHNRLSIIDLSDAGLQPMTDISGRYTIVFNGEVYNYLELRKVLSFEFQFKTHTDTEVILNSFIKWGPACLDKFIGMFSIGIWDDREKSFWAARDRFGVKPFNYAFDVKGNFYFSSEIKALHVAGISKIADESSWSAYLSIGRYDHDENTFWKDVKKLLPGHNLILKNNILTISNWYELSERTGLDFDTRPMPEVVEQYYNLLLENIKLRFRSDVLVGINISGGLDSSALLSIVDKVQGQDNTVKAFTFITNDKRYDELPWVESMISRTKHPLYSCLLQPAEVPSLAESVQYHQDEPFGGLPTIAYAKVFESAKVQGVTVLLDGQGMDEQWAGYDYYRKDSTLLSGAAVQGTTDSPVKPEVLTKDFIAQTVSWRAPEKYPDKLRNLQYRDSFHTKIPRALRFNDRISMRSSTELREPFLDHRLFEIAFCQPESYKINGEQGKWLLRELLRQHLPGNIIEAPKRALQTPQREWLRGELKEWADSKIELAIQKFDGSWLIAKDVRVKWKQFLSGETDNSFYIWQWISLGMLLG